jgi:hypothetical protein
VVARPDEKFPSLIVKAVALLPDRLVGVEERKAI